VKNDGSFDWNDTDTDTAVWLLLTVPLLPPLSVWDDQIRVGYPETTFAQSTEMKRGKHPTCFGSHDE